MLLDKARAVDRTYADLFMGDQENDALTIYFCPGYRMAKSMFTGVPFRRPDGKEIELAVTRLF